MIIDFIFINQPCVIITHINRNSLIAMNDQTTLKSEDELTKKLDVYSTERWEVGGKED